jgi:uncharacterized protein (UPF0128 family)
MSLAAYNIRLYHSCTLFPNQLSIVGQIKLFIKKHQQETPDNQLLYIYISVEIFGQRYCVTNEQASQENLHLQITHDKHVLTRYLNSFQTSTPHNYIVKKV